MSELITCTHCGKQVNPRSVHCPFCGGGIEQPVTAGEPSCPRCKSPMEVLDKDDADVDVCPSCGGFWLDRGEFTVATAPGKVYKDYELKKEYSRPALDAEVNYLPCVRCGKLMVRENFRHISGVIIDRCGRHGVWMDAGELEKIRHFIASGGLDSSQDREIVHNSVALKEIASTAKGTAFMQKLLHLWSLKRILYGGW